LSSAITRSCRQTLRRDGGHNSHLSVEKENLDIRMKANLVNPRISPEGAKLSDLSRVAAEAVNGAREVVLEARMYGRQEDLKVELSSNLDNLISERINAVVRKSMKEAEDKVRADMDAAVNAEKAKLLEGVNAGRKKVSDALQSRQEELQRNLDIAKAKVAELEKRHKGKDRAGAERS